MSGLFERAIAKVLVFVTRVQRNVAHAVAWGVGQSMLLELKHTDKVVLMVDNEGLEDDVFARMLSHELRHGLAHGLDAHRLSYASPGNRFEHVLRELEPQPVDPVSFSPEETIVVTGGLGGVGLLTALWLLEHGARHLLLLSRSGKLRQGLSSSDQEAELLDKIMSFSPDVHLQLCACDVADMNALREVLGQASKPIPGSSTRRAWCALERRRSSRCSSRTTTSSSSTDAATADDGSRYRNPLKAYLSGSYCAAMAPSCLSWLRMALGEALPLVDELVECMGAVLLGAIGLLDALDHVVVGLVDVFVDVPAALTGLVASQQLHRRR